MSKQDTDELDKKLREIIEQLLTNGEMYTPEDVDECVSSIKKLYSDEVLPKVNDMVQDITNLHANMKQDMLRLGLASTPAHTDQLYEQLVAGKKHCYDCVHEEIGNPDVIPYVPLTHIKTIMGKEK